MKKYKRFDHKIDINIENINVIVEGLIIDIKFLSLFPLDQDNIKTDTFITSFEIINLAKTITKNLANCFFEYSRTGNDPNSICNELNSFTYITSKRYTLDEFYRIMIDIEISKQSTARYRQYLAYKNNIFHVQVNKI